MGIITISRGSFNKGKEVAEKVAKKLGYKCISREDILSNSEEYRMPEFSLYKNIQDTKTLFGKYDYAKEKYLAFFESVIYDFIRKDNIVYHGFIGVYYTMRITHSLDVRILADTETRINFVMSSEGYTRDGAIKYIQKLDDIRLKWTLFLYNLDIRDPDLYDVTININKLSTDDATNIIVNLANNPQFTTTPEILQIAENLYLAAKVKVMLIEKYPQVDVKATDGVVTVKIADDQWKALQKGIESIIVNIPEVKDVKVLKLFPFISDSIKDQITKE